MDLSTIRLKIDHQVERENNGLMDEVEGLLETYLAKMLRLSDKRLIRGRIDLPEYLKDVQMLRNCIERFNQAREL